MNPETAAPETVAVPANWTDASIYDLIGFFAKAAVAAAAVGLMAGSAALVLWLILAFFVQQH